MRGVVTHTAALGISRAEGCKDWRQQEEEEEEVVVVLVVVVVVEEQQAKMGRVINRGRDMACVT